MSILERIHELFSKQAIEGDWNKSRKLQIGERVKLIGGNSEMTVVDFDDDQSDITVAWYGEDHKAQEIVIPRSFLCLS